MPKSNIAKTSYYFNGPKQNFTKENRELKHKMIKSIIIIYLYLWQFDQLDTSCTKFYYIAVNS